MTKQRHHDFTLTEAHAWFLDVITRENDGGLESTDTREPAPTEANPCDLVGEGDGAGRNT